MCNSSQWTRGDEIILWGINKNPYKEIEVIPEIFKNPAKLTIIKKNGKTSRETFP